MGSPERGNLIGYVETRDLVWQKSGSEPDA